MKKRFLIFTLILMVLVLSLNILSPQTIRAEQDENVNYIIFSDDGHYLFERADVVVGDEYLSGDFKKYQVISIDEKNLIGIARFVESVKIPKIDFSTEPSQISEMTRKIALYMTHNAESYVPTDGVDSIYGAGGIHDVARSIKHEMQLLGIDVFLDETLHVPHDAAAYTRSKNTANSLIKKYSPDAIFDIHRDGTSRKAYVTNFNNRDHCMVRIVVGKANPNMKVNETFAIYLMSVAKQIYPWLIKDIFYATGHYNQSLSNKSLLFEMGSHLVEKELVIKSIGPLAEVVNTALYGTTVNTKTGDLTINGVANNDEKLVNDALENYKSSKTALYFTLVIGAVFVVLAVLGIAFRAKQKNVIKK